MEELADNKNINIEQQKELFVATIIHDLKNPLNAQIIAMEQLYKEKFGKITPLQKDIINSIISSSKFMREMLSTILSIYKFENGAVKLNKTKVKIDNIIKICIKDIMPFARENNISIEFINISHENTIFCDENYIRRVISNMLNNIVNYSYKKTKSIISLAEEESNLIISFKSTGFPISEDLKSHIFDKYISSYTKKAGTGLGLYFCKKAVEAHGGLITLKSDKSDIEFCIKLPKKHIEDDIIKFI